MAQEELLVEITKQILRMTKAIGLINLKLEALEERLIKYDKDTQKLIKE